MDCPFCEVARGEAAAYVVFEDEFSLAFLDIRPLFPGHCLLIPKQHLETLSDVPPDMVGRLFSNVQLLARAVEDGLNAQGSFIAINNRISQSVPHLHVHIVPRRKKDGLKGFFWPRTSYKSEEEARAVQERLQSAIRTLRPA